MKSLKEQILGKCRHFNGLMNDECKVGIKYETVKAPLPEGTGRSFALPCLLEPGGHCDKCEPYTEAEADAQIEDHKKRMENIMLARAAIVTAIGKPWKKGEPGSSGTVECPVCKGKLSYSRAGYNGHIHARCETKDCVSWME